MGKFDFIISMLNISEDMIQDLSISKKQDTLHIHTTLKSKHPRCPYCDGDTNIKGYSSYSYNHLDMEASLPSSIGNAGDTSVRIVEGPSLRSVLLALRISINPTLCLGR